MYCIFLQAATESFFFEPTARMVSTKAHRHLPVANQSLLAIPDLKINFQPFLD
jgi:hypothetical protein